MNEPKSKNEKPNEERRFSQEQYDMLKRCSEKKEMTEWNEWRKKNRQKDIELEGVNFNEMYLKDIDLGHLLLTIQVILGYVLLGALVTRFAVLFTAGGPAGKFADEKGEKDETE